MLLEDGCFELEGVRYTKQGGLWRPGFTELMWDRGDRNDGLLMLERTRAFNLDWLYAPLNRDNNHYDMSGGHWWRLPAGYLLNTGQRLPGDVMIREISILFPERGALPGMWPRRGNIPPPVVRVWKELAYGSNVSNITIPWDFDPANNGWELVAGGSGGGSGVTPKGYGGYGSVYAARFNAAPGGLVPGSTLYGVNIGAGGGGLTTSGTGNPAGNSQMYFMSLGNWLYARGGANSGGTNDGAVVTAGGGISTPTNATSGGGGGCGGRSGNGGTGGVPGGGAAGPPSGGAGGGLNTQGSNGHNFGIGGNWGGGGGGGGTNFATQPGNSGGAYGGAGSGGAGGASGRGGPGVQGVFVLYWYGIA